MLKLAPTKNCTVFLYIFQGKTKYVGNRLFKSRTAVPSSGRLLMAAGAATVLLIGFCAPAKFLICFSTMTRFPFFRFVFRKHSCDDPGAKGFDSSAFRN